MDSRYVAALDIGTSQISLIVGSIEGSNVQVLHYARARSEGVKDSSIFNPKLCGRKVNELIEEAEKNLGIRIFNIMCSYPRYYVKMYNRDAEGIIGAEDCVTEDMMTGIKNMATDGCPIDDEKNEMVYCAVNQSFSNDDYAEMPEDEVIGMTDCKLTGHFKVFVGSRKSSNNLTTVMNDLGKSFFPVFTPESTALSTLTEAEKETGVALVEVGGGVTSVSIFSDGRLRYYGSTPFAGISVTDDIKRECGFSTDLAENIKLAYGGCLPDRLPGLGDKTIRIEYKENGTYKELPVKYLSEIITARGREIAEAILYHIQKSELADRIPGGIVLTGGGANLLNLSTLFKDMSGYTVRIGYPLAKFASNGCPGVLQSEASPVVGMLLKAGEMPRFNSASEMEYVRETEEEDIVSTAETQENGTDVQRDLFGEIITPETESIRHTQTTKKKSSAKKGGKIMEWVKTQATLFGQAIDESNDTTDLTD